MGANFEAKIVDLLFFVLSDYDELEYGCGLLAVLLKRRDTLRAKLLKQLLVYLNFAFHTHKLFAKSKL